MCRGHGKSGTSILCRALGTHLCIGMYAQAHRLCTENMHHRRQRHVREKDKATLPLLSREQDKPRFIKSVSIIPNPLGKDTEVPMTTGLKVSGLEPGPLF